MALTDEATLDFRGSSKLRGIIEDTVQIFNGAICGLNTSTGEIDNFDDAAGILPVGYCLRTATGNTANTVDAEMNVNGDVIIGATVAGVTAITDHGSLVWATDENTFTLTRPSAAAAPIGLCWLFRGTGIADVKLFSLGESAVLSAGGGTKSLLYLGSMPLSTLANGDMKTGITLYGHGNITGFYSITEVVTTDADADALINLEIGGTNLTGGVITMGDTGDAQPGAGDTGVLGARIDASAITAANTFNDGDLLDVEASGVTAYADGQVGLYIEVEWLLGS